MAKNAVFQIAEIGRHVKRFAGEEVMEGSERITASSKPEEVAEWVRGVVERLDSLMMARARRKKYKTVDEFLEAEQKNPPAGTRLTRKGNVLYQFYTPRSFTRPMRCYCSLLRGLPDGETISITYCQCSKGFVQKYWESILESPVEVELLESCVSGAQECKFMIHL
jgi:hypothetical protein